MLNLARTDLIILDDWGLATMAMQQRHDLLENQYGAIAQKLLALVKNAGYEQRVEQCTF